MARTRKWTILWIAWLVAFVVIEIAATLSRDPKPRTLSEHWWRWFPRKWWRVFATGLLAVLFWHLLSGPDVKPVHYRQSADMEWLP